MKWIRVVRSMMILIVLVVALSVSRQDCRAMDLSQNAGYVETAINMSVSLAEVDETSQDIIDEAVATGAETYAVSRVWLVISGAAFLLILMLFSMLAFK